VNAVHCIFGIIEAVHSNLHKKVNYVLFMPLDQQLKKHRCGTRRFNAFEKILHFIMKILYFIMSKDLMFDVLVDQVKCYRKDD